MKIRLPFSFLIMFLPVFIQAQPKPDSLLTTIYTSSSALHWARFGNADYENEVENPKCGTVFQEGNAWDGSRSEKEYIWTESPCKNGMIDGKWKQYFDHRPWVMIECDYKNGRRDGNYFRYDKRGKVRESRQYRNDSLHGDVKYYNSRGEQEAVEHYRNGKLHGCMDNYNEYCCYTEGRREGRWAQWSGTDRKVKIFELVMKNNLVQSGTYYENYLTATVYPDSVLPDRWVYHQTYTPSGSGRPITIEGKMMHAPDTAAFPMLPGVNLVDRVFHDFAPDGKWTITEGNGRSTTWIFKAGQITNRVLRYANDSGKVAIFCTYYPPKLKQPRTNYRKAQYETNGVNLEEYVVDAVVRRRTQYTPGNLPSKQHVLMRENFDEAGKSFFLLNCFTDGSDSARWVYNGKNQTWKCTWTNADSSRFGYINFNEQKLRHGECRETNRRSQTITTTNYSWNKLQGAYIVTDLNGKTIESGSYQQNVKASDWLEKDNEGVFHQGNYMNGKREGKWTEWYVPGKKKKATGVYKNGFRTGKWKQWNESGHKIRSKKYATK